MIAVRVLLSLTLLVAPVGAQAQALQSRPGEPAIDPHRYPVDQHRLEMERLRARADQRETFTRRLEIETRLNRQRIEAARLPEPVQPAPIRALRSPGEEQTLRRSASERSATTTADVGQIDAWLDRPRD